MTIDDLPYLNVFSPEYAADPHSVIDPVRAVSPLARSERGVEVLAYSDCEDLLRDTGLATGFIEMFEASGISEGPAVDAFKFGIVESEGADHTRLRKAVARYFTSRKIESLRATAHDLVKLWLAEVADQGTILGIAVPAARWGRAPEVRTDRRLGPRPRHDRLKLGCIRAAAPEVNRQQVSDLER